MIVLYVIVYLLIFIPQYNLYYNVVHNLDYYQIYRNYIVNKLYLYIIVFYQCTVVAHMLVKARKIYSMIYAYAVSFIECIDTHN